MANIYSYHGIKPIIKKSAYIHPQAVIIGNVEIGEEVYIGAMLFCAEIGEKSLSKTAQTFKKTVRFTFSGNSDYFRRIGAYWSWCDYSFGAHWQKLFGWDESVVMDNAKIGDECIIGALSFVPTGFISENRKLIVGSPAKIIREVSDEMIAWKTKGTAIYQGTGS
jgi:phenylacetic acid degradation protein